MKIIYAEKSTGIDEDGSFQNPKYFERADKQADSIVIYGDYPEIVAAYKDIGIDAEVRELAKPKGELTTGTQVGITLEQQQIIDDAAAENKALSNKVDALSIKLDAATTSISALGAENTELKAKIAELEKAPPAKKPTAAEQKAAKAAEQAQE